MSRRILLACFETPGYGGAGTATYDLFRCAQADGLEITLLNLVDRDQQRFLQATFGPDYGNPGRLEHVHTHVMRRAFHRAQPDLAALVSDLAPDIILAVGYIAALAMRRAAPRARLVFLTAGCDQIDQYLGLLGTATAVQAWLRAGNRPVLFHPLERRAVEAADLIIAHSELVRELLVSFYPQMSGKLYPDVIWLAEWIHGAAAQHSALALPFRQRDIDLLFVASRWDRPEKNLPMAAAIVDACPDLTAHFVGLLDAPAGRAVSHGLITDRAALFALFGRSRAVVSTSSWDAAPGVLFEAAAMGCNLVASRNCGNWPLCHRDLLVERYAPGGFVEKVRLAVADRYADNAARLLASGSRETLSTVLQVF